MSMKEIFVLVMLALLGCASNKPAAKLKALKAKQCEKILNAPDFIREDLKDLTPQRVEFVENDDVSTIQTCKTFETIICDGVEYRLYDLCLPSRQLISPIITEEDFL